MRVVGLVVAGLALVVAAVIMTNDLIVSEPADLLSGDVSCGSGLGLEFSNPGPGVDLPEDYASNQPEVADWCRQMVADERSLALQVLLGGWIVSAVLFAGGEVARRLP